MAGVGVTLLTELAVSPPSPSSEDVHIVRFADTAPSRRIAMCWRPSSPHHELLMRLAEVFRDLPGALVRVD